MLHLIDVILSTYGQDLKEAIQKMQKMHFLGDHFNPVRYAMYCDFHVIPAYLSENFPDPMVS